MTKHVEIETSNKKILRGYLELPENAKEIVVMFHGFTGNKTEHNGHFRNLARLLATKSIASIRMDYMGNGESDGEFNEFTFDTALEDAKRILKYAKEIKGIEKVDILGFSFGGAIASTLATDENCHKLILVSAAANMPDIARRAFETWTKLENGNVYNNGFEMSYDLVKSLENRNLYENCHKFNNKVLVIAGKEDLAVPYLYGVKYAVSYPNSLLHIIYGSGHGYDGLEHREKMYNYVTEFLLNF